MKSLVLVGENDNLVVECLNGDFEFVHNTLDGSNWFNQKTLAKMFGVSKVSVSNRLKTYLKRVNGNKDLLRKSYKPVIKLKTNNTNQKVLFYDFKAVTYLAFKNNAFNCHELLMANRDWDKRYNEVRDTIEPKKDGSKQSLLF